MGSKILMIEHDPDDRWLTDETFQAEGMGDGVEFIYANELPVYLAYADNRPPLILLTLHTHPVNGLELIREIRQSKGYEKVPVVVLGESALQEEVASCYAAGATSYIKKPSSYSETLFKIKSFINYWFHTVELPA